MSTCDAMSTRSSYGKRSRALLSMAARNPQQELIGANVTAPRHATAGATWRSDPPSFSRARFQCFIHFTALLPAAALAGGGFNTRE